MDDGDALDDEDRIFFGSEAGVEAIRAYLKEYVAGLGQQSLIFGPVVVGEDSEGEDGDGVGQAPQNFDDLDDLDEDAGGQSAAAPTPFVPRPYEMFAARLADYMRSPAYRRTCTAEIIDDAVLSLSKLRRIVENGDYSRSKNGERTLPDVEWLQRKDAVMAHVKTLGDGRHGATLRHCSSAATVMAGARVSEKEKAWETVANWYAQQRNELQTAVQSSVDAGYSNALSKRQIKGWVSYNLLRDLTTKLHNEMLEVRESCRRRTCRPTLDQYNAAMGSGLLTLLIRGVPPRPLELHCMNTCDVSAFQTLKHQEVR